ncbi:hypothetical protein AX15_004417 [Amanita polypyramis BW_CC]|nr:hypothetical protein AX15_004417 [Amanita polypyramis BW_CC]
MTEAAKCIIIILLSVCSALASKSLTLNLSGPDLVRSLSDLTIIANITNTGDEPLCLLRAPNTLISDLPAEKFLAIRKEGQEIPSFIGMRAKFVPRTAATLGVCTSVLPSKSIEIAHDVSQMYDFSSAGKGTYTFTPSILSFLDLEHTGRGQDNYTIMKINVKSVTSVVVLILSDILTPSSPPTAVVRSVEGDHRGPWFFKCNNEQQTAIRLAAKGAQVYASEAYAYLQTHTSQTTGPTPRYELWFGAPTDSRYETVDAHFSALSRNDFSGFRYDCTCSEPDVYAYVWPIQYGVVYLCGKAGFSLFYLLRSDTAFRCVLDSSPYRYRFSSRHHHSRVDAFYV